MSASAPLADASSSGSQPRAQSQSQSQQSSAGAAPAQRNRLLRSRSVVSDGGSEHGHQSDADDDGTPFDELPSWKQLLRLTDDELVDTVLHSWWPNELYLELINEWETKQLEQVCTRLGIVTSNKAGMRTSVRNRIERWAKDNPLLVPCDPTGAAPRTRAAGVKAAKAAVVAQRIARCNAPEVKYSEDDGGAVTEADDSDADSDYEPPTRIDSRSRSSARAVSHRGAGSQSLSKELVAALSSLPSVSASAPSRDRESTRSGRRGAAVPVATAVRASRSRRSRRRDPSPSSSSSLSDSDSDDDSFTSEEDDRSAHRRSSRRSSGRSSSSRDKDDSLVSEWINNVLSDGSTVFERYTAVTAKWNNERNRKEVLVLAKIVDLIRLGHGRQALNRAMRRIAGVQAADQHGSWQISNVLENNMEEQSFLPLRTWNAAFKLASRFETVRKRAQAAGGSGSFGGKDKA